MINNEYGKLKTCIVGDFTSTPFPKSLDNKVSLDFRSFYNDNLFKEIRKTVKCKSKITLADIQYIAPQIEAERKEDLDNLSKVLVKNGIQVFRPNKHTSVEINSPNWTSTTYPAGNVRDNILCISNYIIETSPHIRGRIFENELLYDALYYFTSKHKEIIWCKLPSSRLCDNNIDQSYYTGKVEKFNKHECIFDAAQCMKFDEGLLINYSNKNHLLGIEYLKRLLPNMNIYPISITDSHIDGSILPISNDTILITPQMESKIKLLPDWLQKYKRVILQDLEKDYKDSYMLASENILINCLAIDNKKVIINKNAKNTIKELKKLNFEIIPIQFRHSRIYSGGIHCSTLDLDRF